MLLADFNLNLTIVFFIYGLAFFTMGIALSLEVLRSPLLAEGRVLRPLAVFGLLHGMHEWMEIIILQRTWSGVVILSGIDWFRIGWLTISFVPLVAFAFSALVPQPRLKTIHLYIAAGFLLFYLGIVIYQIRSGQPDILGRADALARYLLAVPAGLLAGLGFRFRAGEADRTDRHDLAKRFRWAALAFFTYGLTQILVSGTDMFPARFLNASLFFALTGFPVQVVRAAMAVIATVSLIQAIQFVERERRQQMLSAQLARVEALEQVQRELVERETLRRQLLRHTVIAQEEERARIAREIHDETAQILTAFSLNLAVLQTAVNKQSEETKMISRLQSMGQRMSQGLYRIVHDLRPAQLDDLGLVSALRYLIDEVRERMRVQVTLEVTGNRRRLDPLVETVVFRVAQEALMNVGRHAQIDHALLQLCFDSQSIILRIQDEGIGFQAHQVFSPPRGWGLAGMRERAESLDGEFFLHSAIGEGTLIEVRIPLVPEKNEAMSDAPADDIPVTHRFPPASG